MTALFFASVADLEEKLTGAPRVLICLDVEKILCADDKVTRAPVLRELRQLSGRPRVTVAVFSSSSRAELQAQIGIPGLVYVGNLGLEISGAGFLLVEPTAAGYADSIAQLGSRLAAKLASVPSARVENKGLTIRVVASGVAETDSEQVRHMIHEALATANHPYHLTSHEKVYEIRPRVPWTKADAVHWIRDRLEEPGCLVIYLGDDETDDETVAALPDAITIKVGGPIQTLANYRLEGAADVVPFLNWLERMLPGSG
jgi:trehalose 6-phosphate phosphatase